MNLAASVLAKLISSEFIIVLLTYNARSMSGFAMEAKPQWKRRRRACDGYAFIKWNSPNKLDTPHQLIPSNTIGVRQPRLAYPLNRGKSTAYFFSRFSLTLRSMMSISTLA